MWVGEGAIVGVETSSNTTGAKDLTAGVAEGVGVSPGDGGIVDVRKGVGERPSSNTAGAKERAAGVAEGVGVLTGEGGGGGGVTVASGAAALRSRAAGI